MTQKIYHIDKFFCHHQKIFLLKNTLKVALQQYLFSVFILFKVVSYFKPNFKLKVDLKMCTYKNLEEIWKTWKNFGKNEWQPCQKFLKIVHSFFQKNNTRILHKIYLEYLVNTDIVFFNIL